MTNVLYTTQTNIDGDIAVESILRTHIANILYSLLIILSLDWNSVESQFK